MIWNLHLEFPEIILRRVLGSGQSPSIPKIPSWNSSRLSVCSGLSSFAACSCFQLYFHSLFFLNSFHTISSFDGLYVLYFLVTSQLFVHWAEMKMEAQQTHNSVHSESQNKTQSFNQRFDPRSPGVNWLLALLTEVFYQSKFLSSF